jgi:hypothetical protein
VPLSRGVANLDTIMAHMDGNIKKTKVMAEREGFEPSIQVLARITV